MDSEMKTSSFFISCYEAQICNSRNNKLLVKTDCSSSNTKHNCEVPTFVTVTRLFNNNYEANGE